MRSLNRIALIVDETMLAALIADGAIAQAANSLDIVIASGRQGGTYRLPASNILSVTCTEIDEL